MGHIELCFQCGNVDSSPRGLPESEWDWKVIKKLLEELELPILKKDEDYTKLYTEKRASSEGGAESAAAPASKSKSEGKPEPESEGRSQ